MTAFELTAPAFDAVCRVADAGASGSERPSALSGRPSGWSPPGTVSTCAPASCETVGKESWPARSRRTGPRSAVRCSPTRSARCTVGVGVGEVRSGVAALDGTGMGHEELADSDTLEPDMVVFVEVLDGDIVDGAVVHVTADGPHALSAR